MNFVYLLDTNIISELTKANPDANVRMKVKNYQKISAIPSVVWSESLYGINVLPVSKKRSLLEGFYLNTVLSTYPILPFDNHAASILSDIKSRLHAIGRPAPVLDMQIASIAIANNMILVTRNIQDFENTCSQMVVFAKTIPGKTTVTYDDDTNTLDFGLSTANSIESVVLTSTVGAVKTYTITFTDGTTTTFSVTDGEVTEASLAAALADYAKTDGYYENMGSGYADNLATDIRAASQVPYIFQTAGGSVDIGDREYLNAVVGGSLPINQLVNPSTLVESVSDKYVTATGNRSTGEVTVNGTATGGDASCQITSGMGTQIKDHIYYLYQPSGTSASTFFVRSSSETFWNFKHIGKGDATGAINLRVLVKNGQTVNLTFKPMLIDLTLLLGSKIADYIYTLEQATTGAGVAWCKAHFPKIVNAGYIPYNAGTMEHVAGVSSHDTIGFNQFDKANASTIIGGYFEHDDTAIKSGSGRVAVYIPCLPNTEYCASRDAVSTNERFCIAWAKELPDIGTPIYNPVQAPSSQTVGNKMEITTTTGTDAAYIVVWAYWGGLTEALDSLCINISWDGSRDGEYESYIKRTYPLDSSVVLRGVPKLDASNNLYYDGDVYAYDGTVTRRYGIVDLGSLTWNYPSAWASWHTDYVADMRGTDTGVETPKFICDKFETIATNYGLSDFYEGMGISSTTRGSSGCRILVKNGSTTIPPTGHLVYELATPTTE